MSNISFCVTGGDGEFGRQALACVRSIRLQYPDAPIVVVVPDDESQSAPLPDDVFIRKGKVPISGYKLSTKINTLAIAEQAIDSRPLCLLDSDILLTDRLSFPAGYNLYVKPEDCNWWPEASEKTWRSLYNAYGFSIPETRVQSTVDKQTMWPYFNAGVVISNQNSFGQRWRQLTTELRKRNSPINKTRYADQIALGMLSTELDTAYLTEDQNFPLVLRLSVPSSVEAIHYHNPLHLLKAFRYKDVIRQIGLDELMPYSWSSITIPIGFIKVTFGTANWRVRCRLH